ncbi:hypothetical protein SteCoe_20720 [Stentor coeruleus]|uniref:Dihydrolipoamide acetyltransferase component of pyruvate dehydrogenase complex n=1 Tax=Stentor coeruleus TaxID=5963 RepID=A0A1R2BR88_9CILI|nr:hypothetical protein SteCoe_20720 [Stentor coeruleus]
MLKFAMTMMRRFADLPPHTVLGMPSLSPTMTTGTMVKWLKKEGDKVNPGDIMFEVETDKATLGYEVQDQVFVAKILAQAGSPPMPLGAPIAILVDKADRIAAFKNYQSDSESTKSQELIKNSQKDEPKHDENIRMSPAAHHMIDEYHLNTKNIPASGPRGLILKEDVLSFIESNKSPKETQKKLEEIKVPEKKTSQDYEKNLVSNIRAPRFSVASNINLEEAIKFIGKDNIQAFIIKAAVSSCKIVPEANSKFFPEFTRYYDYVDLQVSLYEKKLKKYFLKDSQGKRIEEIKEAFKKEGTGQANFALSFSSEGNEIATPDVAALLSVGPEFLQVVKSGEGFKSQKFVTCTLNCDHRAVDGAVGANWLKTFKGFIENPVSLL